MGGGLWILPRCSGRIVGWECAQHACGAPQLLPIGVSEEPFRLPLQRDKVMSFGRYLLRRMGMKSALLATLFVTGFITSCSGEYVGVDDGSISKADSHSPIDSKSAKDKDRSIAEILAVGADKQKMSITTLVKHFRSVKGLFKTVNQ